MKDIANSHYAYLLPLDEFTGRVITIGHDKIWLDGLPIFGVVCLYNGKVINKKPDVD